MERGNTRSRHPVQAFFFCQKCQLPILVRACSLPKMTSQKRQANNSFPQCSGNRYFYFLENSPASVSPSLPQLRAATSLRKINSCSLNSFKMLLLRSKPTFNADTHTACKILILFFFKCALDTWSYLENDLLAWVQ